MIHLPNLATIEHLSEQELRAAYAHILNALNMSHSSEDYALLLALRSRVIAALNRKRSQPHHP